MQCFMMVLYYFQKNECATLCIDIPKEKHRFLLAQKGDYIQDLLLETNVSIEVPRLDSDEETVILRGLINNIGYGKLYFLVT